MSDSRRTCVVCRKKFGKDQILRFAELNSKLVLDVKQNIQARGCYCCKSEACLFSKATVSRLLFSLGKKDKAASKDLSLGLLKLLENSSAFYVEVEDENSNEQVKVLMKSFSEKLEENKDTKKIRL